MYLLPHTNKGEVKTLDFNAIIDFVLDFISKIDLDTIKGYVDQVVAFIMSLIAA